MKPTPGFCLSRTVEVEMVRHFNGPSPGCPQEQQHCLQALVAFWNGLSCNSDAGETTWGVLEGLQSQVSKCLSHVPPDLARASLLTAEAALLMTGRKGL